MLTLNCCPERQGKWQETGYEMRDMCKAFIDKSGKNFERAVSDISRNTTNTTLTNVMVTEKTNIIHFLIFIH